MASFQLSGIDPRPLQPLFDLDAAALAAHGAVRCIASSDHGFPCRVSLRDAAVGEELLLLPYWHQPAASPYRASGPVFVRRDAVAARLAVDEVPDYVRRRLISLRAYNHGDRIATAEVLPGTEVAGWLQAQLGDRHIAYVHLHNARYGCYSCRADRVA
ncbi:MAG TPA: DUF1203 domain-containing protein [Stenotrophomonas sp.]|nr:DUF1203 domain-containing protein [Stenotrophomonas sp.]